MNLNLSDFLKDKASEFPESSYGANRVTLILSDGRKIRKCLLDMGYRNSKNRRKQNFV
jgi:hypothetical protein